MSIASYEASAPIVVPLPQPEGIRMLHGVPMTIQNRIRYQFFLTVGHQGSYLEFQCHSQAPWELERDGPLTPAVLAERVDGILQEPRITEERRGFPVPAAIRAAVRDYILSLDDGVSREINFRKEPVRVTGTTHCESWRDAS